MHSRVLNGRRPRHGRSRVPARANRTPRARLHSSPNRISQVHPSRSPRARSTSLAIEQTHACAIVSMHSIPIDSLAHHERHSLALATRRDSRSPCGRDTIERRAIRSNRPRSRVIDRRLSPFDARLSTKTKKKKPKNQPYLSWTRATHSGARARASSTSTQTSSCDCGMAPRARDRATSTSTVGTVGRRATTTGAFLFFESRPVSACPDVDLSARLGRRVGTSLDADVTSSHHQCAPWAMSFHRLGRRFGTSPDADADATSSHSVGRGDIEPRRTTRRSTCTALVLHLISRV